MGYRTPYPLFPRVQNGRILKNLPWGCREVHIGGYFAIFGAMGKIVLYSTFLVLTVAGCIRSLRNRMRFVHKYLGSRRTSTLRVMNVRTVAMFFALTHTGIANGNYYSMHYMYIPSDIPVEYMDRLIWDLYNRVTDRRTGYSMYIRYDLPRPNMITEYGFKVYCRTYGTKYDRLTEMIAAYRNLVYVRLVEDGYLKESDLIAPWDIHSM